ncbi:hypothetical protein MKZ38_002832 [Zalerion maritima]|uniref:Uncharacterized protein n=1 Tax=Zalerion maritima TaxID=339359 RepID=A0AAD5WR02_9PEZI|nr:hypothetical protein MKZ38_002832 [Zalerion maritima]
MRHPTIPTSLLLLLLRPPTATASPGARTGTLTPSAVAIETGDVFGIQAEGILAAPIPKPTTRVRPHADPRLWARQDIITINKNTCAFFGGDICGSTATAVGCAANWVGVNTLSNFPNDGNSYVREEDVETTESSSSSATSSSSPSGSSSNDGQSESTTTITSSSPTATESGGSEDGGSSTPTGPIVGGIVGGLAVVGLVVLGVVFLLRKKKSEAHENQPLAHHPPPPPQGYPSPSTWGDPGTSPMHGQLNPEGTAAGYYSNTAPQTSPRYGTQPGQARWMQPGHQEPKPPFQTGPVELA